jgi:hypothetical protein
MTFAAVVSVRATKAVVGDQKARRGRHLQPGQHAHRQTKSALRAAIDVGHRNLASSCRSSRTGF